LTYALVGAREPALAALADLDRVGSIPDRMLEPDLTRARAWVALVTGHRADAERLLREAADAAAEAGQLILEAAALHDVARIGSAAAVADRLAVVARECQGELVPARAAHVAALAAEDPYALEAAALTFVSMQAELFAAEAYAEAARHFRRHRLSTRATECAKRRDSLRAACGTPWTPALRNRDEPSPLTGREREIASLAAEGMASREIAVQLSLSVRTVDNHLRRVYEKFGVSTRAALASEVLPRGS
jgi:DNA-binding CsgD family transcriptional regulator